MVTLQEVEQREEELRKLEVESINISREPIPQRRYGFGITPEIQKQYISRRGQAKNIISQLPGQREQLQTIRDQIKENERIQKENERIQAEYEAKQREYADYERGREIAFKGGAYGVFALENETQRQGYRDAKNQVKASKARAEYQKQIADLKSQGLKPVYADGKLTGFEDLSKQMSIPLESIPKFLEQNPIEIKRYEQAKLVQVSEVKKTPQELLFPPYLVERTTGSFKPKGSSSSVPIKNVFYQDINLKPFGIRVATQEEKDYYYSERKVQAESNKNIIYPTKTGAKINKIIEQNRYNFQQNNPRLAEIFRNIGTRITPEEILSLSFPASKVPYKITIPARALARESVSTESALRVIKGGEEIRIAKFDIFTEIKPPRIELIRGKGQGLLDALEIEKGTTFVKTKPTSIVAGENPYLSISAKNIKYGKVGKIDEITPLDNRFINLEEINSLPPVEKYLLQRLAETKTGGGPVSIKNINKFLSKDDLYIRGVLEVKDTAKIKALNKRSLEITGSGKKLGTGSKQYFTISSIKKAGETKYLEFYDIKTIFKDVTKPLSRATGKTPILKTKVAELKEPLVLDKSEVNFISPASITKTPMSKTFSEQILRQVLAKAPPKMPRVPRVRSVLSLRTIQRESVFSVSRYAGQGLYERTEGGNIPGERISIEKVRSSFSIKPLSLENQAPLERASMRERPSMKEDLRLKNIFLEKNILKETNVLKQNPIEKNILRERQVQKQRQIQKEKLIFKPVTKTPPPRIPRTPRITIPKIPTPIIPRFNFNLSPGGSSKEVPGYLPFVLKKGKKVYLGPIAPRGKALSIAERRAKETLRATFGAEKTGFKIKEKDINFRPEKKFFRSFRIKKGKKIPLKDTFIQKLGKRLSFKGEVQEIQSFRGLKR